MYAYLEYYLLAIKIVAQSNQSTMPSYMCDINELIKEITLFMKIRNFISAQWNFIRVRNEIKILWVKLK